MKHTYKKAFALAGISAILAASALSLFSCDSAYDAAIPEGWEVVRTGKTWNICL